MKKHKLLMLMFASAAMLFAACEKDNGSSTTDSSGNNGQTVTGGLTGTTWWYHYHDGSKKDEGGGLRFMTDTEVYVLDWEFEHGEYVEDIEGPYTYTFNTPNGVINHPQWGNGSSSFSVDGETMVWYEPDEGRVVLSKQHP